MNAKNTNEQTPLLYAISNEIIEGVKELLKHPKIDVNAKNKRGDTILLEMINYKRKIDVVKELLKHPKIDVNAKDKDGLTPLINAVRYKNVEAVRELLKHPNIDLDYRDGYLRAADDWAELNNRAIHDPITQEILELFENPNEVVDNVGRTKLIMAGITETKRLIQHPKIDTNKQDNFGRSALSLATQYGDLEKIELLLANQKTNVNITNKQDKSTTAFHMLADFIENHLYNEKDTIKRIIQVYKKRQDFEIDAVDDRGDTVFIRLLTLFINEDNRNDKRMTDKLLEIVKLFIQEGANPTLSNNKGKTILNLSKKLPNSVKDEIQTLYTTYLSKQ